MFGAALGSFADKVAADWNGILPLPDNISFDQGAGESWIPHNSQNGYEHGER